MLRNDTTQQTQRTSAHANLLRTCRLCCGLVVNLLPGVTNLLSTCHGETGVMDFGLYCV